MSYNFHTPAPKQYPLAHAPSRTLPQLQKWLSLTGFLPSFNSSISEYFQFLSSRLPIIFCEELPKTWVGGLRPLIRNYPLSKIEPNQTPGLQFVDTLNFMSIQEPAQDSGLDYTLLDKHVYTPIDRVTQGCMDAINHPYTNIVVFEFLAMVLFSFCVIWKGGLITFPGILLTYTGMLAAIILSGSFGCGHINPAVTVALMLKRENRTPWMSGIIFIVVQFVAAFVGTYIAWASIEPGTHLTAPFPDVHGDHELVITFFSELIGSGLFVLCVLILVSTDTTFCSSNGQTWGSVPLALIAVCILTKLGLGTNPAQALAFQVAYYTYMPGTYVQLQKIWSVVVGAEVGGLIAGLFFEFVYRRYIRVYKTDLTFEIESLKSRRLQKLSGNNATEQTQAPEFMPLADASTNRHRTTVIEMS